ncbi:MAG: hypothetical protein KGH98_00780 [Candidatus Micrarchaeota archaeon]|nr:hypothetical protein [Candidatus Micrarchaeota archaeon]
MDLFTIRIASVVVVALIYMLFDIFNKRNVPSLFAYATLAYGLLLTVAYLDVMQIAVSLLIAVVVLSLGYVVYKIGQIGEGDIIELGALSLMLPIQIQPILGGTFSQFGMPFVVSVLIGTGIAALVILPIYYLPKAAMQSRRAMMKSIGAPTAFKALLITTAYLALMAFLMTFVGANPYAVVLLALMLIGSVTTVLFEKPITRVMVDYVNVDKFDEGDIIAFNLMEQKAIDQIKRKVRIFDRLVTPELISEMRSKNVRAKLPVYKQAMPLALPIFIGAVASLLFGNVLLYILPL